VYSLETFAVAIDLEGSLGSRPDLQYFWLKHLVQNFKVSAEFHAYGFYEIGPSSSCLDLRPLLIPLLAVLVSLFLTRHRTPCSVFGGKNTIELSLEFQS
jgi:hypothetical protein